MNVDRRMRQIDITGADAVPRRVEHVPVALLNGDREFLLGPRFHLAHLGLLVLRQVNEAFRLSSISRSARRRWVFRRISSLRASSATTNTRLFRNNSQGRTFRLLSARIDSLDQLGNILNRTANSHPVISQDDEFRATVRRSRPGTSNGPPGKRHRLERLAAEYLRGSGRLSVGTGFPCIDVTLPHGG